MRSPNRDKTLLREIVEYLLGLLSHLEKNKWNTVKPELTATLEQRPLTADHHFLIPYFVHNLHLNNDLHTTATILGSRRGFCTQVWLFSQLRFYRNSLNLFVITYNRGHVIWDWKVEKTVRFKGNFSSAKWYHLWIS